MKLGIVTVYHSYNCGSFLQAYALHKTLSGMGCNVYFIKNSLTIEARLPYRLLQAAKYICTGKTKRAMHVLKVYKNFKNARNQLPVVSGYQNLDAVIYGSDTIWNIDDTYFLKHWRRFFGAEYNGTKIAYGASIGSTAPQKLFTPKMLCDAISSFHAVAARDQATYDFAKGCCGEDRTVTSVLDPTMLLTRSVYEEIAAPIAERSYILFYYFGLIPENIKKQVRTFADKTGRKIIAFGENHGWADAYVSNDPFLMMGYYKNADMVITNTFHGNIFSIIFNKPFVSFGLEKQKVCSLLEQFGLSDRLANTDAQIVSFLKEEIDYTPVNQKLEVLRQTSLLYLQQQIDDLKDKKHEAFPS